MKLQQTTKRNLKVILAVLSFAMLVFLTVYAIFLQSKIDNVQSLIKQGQISAVTQPVKPRRQKAARKKTTTTVPSTTQ